MTDLAVDDESAWQHWRNQWRLRDDTIYLNHGSFGPPPEPVRAARQKWIDQLDRQPMDFFVRTFEPAWHGARDRLAQFVGTQSDNLAFTENATFAMNVVADSFPLSASDEVLLTDHEYGAVTRIWQRACRRAGTCEPRIATLSLPVQSTDQLVDAIFAEVTDRTRLIVVSHITSATAMILPVEDICGKARELSVSTCVDGPHALVQVPLAIDSLGCDFYTASCHKWLCAPFGSGFLYVHPQHHNLIEPLVLSFGTPPPKQPEAWSDEFFWNGTRDPSAYLAVPDAIDFMESVGLESFRARTHSLARYARERLLDVTGLEPVAPDSADWYASMVLVPLPIGDALSLQMALWDRFGIEVPIIDFGGQRFIRVSCHLYNTRNEIDKLVEALTTLLAEA